MSWAKKKTIKAVISETAEKNQTENSLKYGGKYGHTQKPNKKAVQMTKEDIWEYTKMRIIGYAPVMIPLVYLPVVHTEGKADILCNGKEIYISDKFWELPLDDIMYMTVKEFTQVLLGFRIEKNIEISDSVVEKDIVKLEAEMMFARVQNMLCNTLLLCRPGDAGVSRALIKPSEKLLSYIHKSFGVYTDCNKRYVKYIDDADSLTSFKDEWNKKALTRFQTNWRMVIIYAEIRLSVPILI
ncbi:MAG: hypothetical protein LUD77_08255 [Clostridiales bacterium]|nr:hypothetical protein [Clostridiales bacterium]